MVAIAVGGNRCARCHLDRLPGLPEAAPVAGDRFPWLQLKLRPDGSVEDLYPALDDTRFNLILIGQPAASAEALKLRRLLRTLAIPADPSNEQELVRAHLGGPSFYLLRPDGHVGLAGARFEAAAVARYLADCHIRVDAPSDDRSLSTGTLSYSLTNSFSGRSDSGIQWSRCRSRASRGSSLHRICRVPAAPFPPGKRTYLGERAALAPRAMPASR